ncbi:MAG TPA: hypothetical protein VJR71_04130 [Pseudolabrys sp.]|nr:hypothetical protein [Pseudolabrys sp.]
MLKKLAYVFAASIVVAAFSLPAQARYVAHAGHAHVGNISGARVGTVHRDIYRGGVVPGQYGRYGYYRPGWGVAAGVAGAAVGAAVANRYGYAYDNGYYGGAGYYGAGHYGGGYYDGGYYGGYPNESHDAN